MTPVILNLLTIEAAVLSSLTIFVILGYLLRVSTLCFLGGLMAFFHKKQESALVLFQLGIVAPALVTGMINGANVHMPTGSLVTEAQASVVIKEYGPKVKSAMQQFSKGFFGSSEEQEWFVIVGEYEDLKHALMQADEIRKNSQYYAEVYRPYEDFSGYTVVIGEHLSLENARLMATEAIKFGLEPTLWKYKCEYTYTKKKVRSK